MMQRRALLIALALSVAAAVIAILLVAYLGDGKVASIVDYTIPTTFAETVLEAISALLTAVFIGAVAAGAIKDWEYAPVVTVVALAALLLDGVAIFYLAGNLFWLLVDVVLLGVTLIGLDDVLNKPEKRRRR